MKTRTVHPVEKTIHFVTRVVDLPHAWSFVMECLEEVKSPRIKISPVWVSTDGFKQEQYDVQVDGVPIE